MTTTAKPTPIECESCEGEGYHGIEEESGCPYDCYACGGTGWAMPEPLQDEPA